MKKNEERIDQLIQEALSTEESEYFNSLEEPTLLEEALGLLKGRNQWISIMVLVVTLLFMAAGIFSAIRVFESVDIRDMIIWSGMFFFSFGAIAAIKIWSWMEMDKNALMRELKRLELQISFLTKKIGE